MSIQPSDTDEAFHADHARIYSERTPRLVPGFADLHRMTSMLLSEHIQSQGRVLVLGAGGGLELKVFADNHPDWTFDGVDPSADMLEAAKLIVGSHSARMRFHHGYIDTAPEGPFDGGVCLLTFHFIPREERLKTLREIRRRLVSNAPFILAHISFPQSEPQRSMWIARHVAFAGTDPAHTEAAKHAIATRLSVLSPEEDEAMLMDAGFSGVSLFYAGLTFRGWVGYA